MTQKNDPSKAPAWPGRPYNYFSDYLREKYRCRVLKIPIHAGLTCPNRDGTSGDEGCIFCSEEGSATPGVDSGASIPEQMATAKNNFKRSDSGTKYIAYFQAFSNTYAPLTRLKSLYDLAVSQEDIIGLMVGTRPDCCPDEVLDLLASYRRPGFELWLELGLQTIHDRSLGLLRRGHTGADSRSAVSRAAERGIPVCAHIILGIPGESWKDMMITAGALRDLPLRGIKFHHLHIIRGTELERMFIAGTISVLSLREYVSLLCDFMERIPAEMLIHRLMGDREENTLVAPRWGLHKGTVMKAIDDEFMRRGTWQGFLCDETRRY